VIVPHELTTPFGVWFGGPHAPGCDCFHCSFSRNQINQFIERCRAKEMERDGHRWLDAGLVELS
jgi:hypothetical protein